MIKIFPPLTLAEAQGFAVCEKYKTFIICVYLGGGGTRTMFWGYIIYDAAGDRYHFNELPTAKWDGSTVIAYSWDIPEALAYYRGIVDGWSAFYCCGSKSNELTNSK